MNRDTDMETKEKVCLSPEEAADLKSRIEQEIENIQNRGTITKRKADDPDAADEYEGPGKKWNQEIYLAAHSGDKELYGLASVLTFYLVRPFFSRRAAKYQNSAKKPEINDFMNDLYVKIFQMLDQYNPECSPITWLKPWSAAVFQTTKRKEMGLTTSHYYQNILVTITKAGNELEAAGKTNPSDYDIFEYLSDHYPEKHISLTTITRCRAQDYTLVTADTNPYLESPDTSKNPEVAMIAKEQSDSFEKLKSSLTKRNRLIIDIEHEYIRQCGEMPDVETVARILNRTDPSLTTDDVSRMVSAAHQEVKRAYNRLKERKPAESVITLNAWQWDEASMEEEEKMLMKAIEEDPSILDIL